jgi:hypothetical protein
MNLLNIAESWYDFLTADFNTKELMRKRLAVCDSCTHKVQLNTAGKFIVTAINEEASIYRCGLCTCPLAAKTANPKNSCRIEKWGVAGTGEMY